MKSIYGKLIIGFLVSILFSFSIAGYFSLRKNANELGLLAVEELQNSTELIEDFMNLIDSDDLDKILGSRKLFGRKFDISKDREVIEYLLKYRKED